jgi:2,3-bisphosphoglycerate-independent phosphoglycerate mutase
MDGKYIILIGDGMADWPIPAIGNRTPLEAADKPNMDFMAANGSLGMVQVVPKDMYPGSDVSNLSILGYDPSVVYTGRSPLEAASMGISLQPDDVAVRCNLVALKHEGADSEMEDFSAGHISTSEAAELLASLQDVVADQGVRFHTGVSYRHLMVWPGGSDIVKTTPPHDIHGKKITRYLPQGDGAEFLLTIMERSREIFPDHPVNRKRVAQGKLPGNAVWLWGQGKAPSISTFEERFGLSGSVVAAVDLIKGIGIYAGLDVVNVPGATGYTDTNYAGKAEYALRELERKDFVLIHVEAPDEAGHNGSVGEKIRAIERIDREMLTPLLARAREKGDLRILLMPDHATPIEIRTHAQEPVPFVIYPSPPGLSLTPGRRYTEAEGRDSGQYVPAGIRLIEYLLVPTSPQAK